MKKVIFLALGFSSSKDGGLYSDLIKEIHSQGNDIVVVAPSNNGKPGLNIENGIKVIRVKAPEIMKVGMITKGISTLLMPYLFKLAIKRSKISLDFDAIILPTPPITLGILAKWLKKKTSAKVYLILRDIFPQNAVDLKMMNDDSLIYNYFRRKEIQLYSVSDAIGCMSNANINYIINHNSYLDKTKLHLLPNWQKLPKFKNTESSSLIRSQYGLENKFVIIFGGNIGRPQKLENIIALAKSLNDIKDIVFLIIGDGTEKNKLADLIRLQKVDNVILKDYIPRADYNKLILLADIGLISLSEEFTIPNFPSKVLSYFASKRPVLASIDLNTDFGDMLEETNSGLWAEAGKTEELKEKLLYMYHNPDVRMAMGENGHNYMKEHLLPNHAYNTILKHI